MGMQMHMVQMKNNFPRSCSISVITCSCPRQVLLRRAVSEGGNNRWKGEYMHDKPDTPQWETWLKSSGWDTAVLPFTVSWEMVIVTTWTDDAGIHALNIKKWAQNWLLVKLNTKPSIVIYKLGNYLYHKYHFFVPGSKHVVIAVFWYFPQ